MPAGVSSSQSRERGVLVLGLGALALGAAALALRWLQADLPGGEERRLVLTSAAALALPAGAALLGLRRALARNLVPLLSIAVGVSLALALFVLVDVLLGYAGWRATRGSRPSLDGELHRRDPLLGWVPRPSAVFRDRFLDEFDVQYHIDADGLRQIPLPGEDGAGAPRRSVFFFGDSFTFASGVEDDETYSAVIAREYLEPSVRVRNAGVIGHGLVQMLARYQAFAPQVEAGDLVVFAPIDADLWRNLDDFYHLSLALYDPASWSSSFPRFEAGGIEARPLATPWNFLRAPFFGARYSQRFFRLLNRALTGPRSMAQAHEILAAAESLSRERRARFVLTFLPDDSAILKGEYDFDLSSFDYIDLRRFFPSEPDAVRALHYPRDRHWNPAGHRVAARALVAGLLEAGALAPAELRPGAAALLEPLGAVASREGG